VLGSAPVGRIGAVVASERYPSSMVKVDVFSLVVKCLHADIIVGRLEISVIASESVTDGIWEDLGIVRLDEKDF
jgi:hypothetical protein